MSVCSEYRIRIDAAYHVCCVNLIVSFVNAGDATKFDEIRKQVSEIVGQVVLPKIFGKYGVPIEAKANFAPRDLVYLVGRALRGKVPESILRECASLSSEKMQQLLETAKVVKPGDHLYGDFAAMKDKAGKLWDSRRQKILDASILTMNAAWRSMQLGLAVNNQERSRIAYTGASNFGTFEEMVRAMYKEGADASGGNPKIGVLRAVFELAKDLKPIHSV